MPDSEAALMLRALILSLAAVAMITTTSVAAIVIGTAAATYAIGRATLTMTVPTTPQWPARYVGRSAGLS